MGMITLWQKKPIPLFFLFFLRTTFERKVICVDFVILVFPKWITRHYCDIFLDGVGQDSDWRLAKLCTIAATCSETVYPSLGMQSINDY